MVRGAVMMRRWGALAACLLLLLGGLAGPAQARKPSLAKWKPAFDYSQAKYKIKVSNVSHPAIKGVYAGFAIRDAMWKATNGRIYFEYLPFSMLGGEVAVLNQLQRGAIQGMAVSSIAATNLGPRMGLVNLPFVVDSYEKMERFVADRKLFQHFLDGMEHQGIMGLDVTSYGTYGWATTVPVRNLADAKKAKFRISSAAVNKSLYKAWGFNPVIIPWPDVPTALKHGVITGLDHTLIVHYLTRKFDVAKNYTPINYAQGLFIWVFNKAWFQSLPADLQSIFRRVVKEQCAIYREQTRQQEEACLRGAKKKGVRVWEFDAGDMARLKQQAQVVNQQFSREVGADYLAQVQRLMRGGATAYAAAPQEPRDDLAAERRRVAEERARLEAERRRLDQQRQAAAREQESQRLAEERARLEEERRRLEAERQRLAARQRPVPHTPRPRLYVLAVGVSRYQDPNLNLRYADSDARAFAQTLAEQPDRVFSRVHQKVLVNQSATREAILQSFSSFLGRAVSDDVVVIFVAGHGVKKVDTDSYFFLPHGATPKNLLSNGLSWFAFDEAVKTLRGRVKNVVLVLDTCHAGGIQVAMRGVSVGQDLSSTFKRRGMFVLAAAQPSEEAEERPRWGHGAFTYALVGGLQGKADFDRDGTVDVVELFKYVERQVADMTEGRQHPHYRMSGGSLPLRALP